MWRILSVGRGYEGDDREDPPILSEVEGPYREKDSKKFKSLGKAKDRVPGFGCRMTGAGFTFINASISTRFKATSVATLGRRAVFSISAAPAMMPSA